MLNMGKSPAVTIMMAFMTLIPCLSKRPDEESRDALSAPAVVFDRCVVVFLRRA
jgi:hypothetical protein